MIEITKMQKLYLLHLLENPEENKITSLARAFSCSKPNSKNILDNMMVEGLLYKERNSYKMTKIGKGLADRLEADRQALEIYLQDGLAIDKDQAIEDSYKFLDQDLEDLAQVFIGRAEIIEKFQGLEKIGPGELGEKLPRGQYRGKLLIENLKKDWEKPSLRRSMAMEGFSEDLVLDIGSKSHVIVEARPIRRSLNGYSKSGKANQISYRQDGQDIYLEYGEGKFYIPLEILENWNLIGGTILETTVFLSLDSIVGFGSHHQKEAAFSIFIDLGRLERITKK